MRHRQTAQAGIFFWLGMVNTIKQKKIDIINLSNSRGDSIQLLTLGGIIKEWQVMTCKNGPINIILGYPHIQSYLKDHAYHGAIAGRYCNRIKGSRFYIGNKKYQLLENEGENHLHGGPEGFNRKNWTIKEMSKQSVTLCVTSEHGDQGYPGNLIVTVRYTLDDSGALNFSWQAVSDQDTVVSLTQHAYFNLAGSGDVRNHYLRMAGSHYTPVDSEYIPTGEIRSVENTPLDFRKFTLLGPVLECEHPEILRCEGLDHNWVSDSGFQFGLDAELYCPETNLLLKASSDLPGIQCYSGNGLQIGGGHGRHEGVCLEFQYFPNSPNQNNFPSPVLLAGKTMQHTSRYQVCEVTQLDMIDNDG